MKTTQILYLALFVCVVVWVITSTHLLDGLSEGFTGIASAAPHSEPVIPKGVEPARLPIQAMPNAANPGGLPFGPYLQTASVGSYPYQDPAYLPAELNQMKQANEDVRAFLVFEGSQIADSSDPTVQLPLTQLRSDSRRLQQEISVLEKNPGVQSSLKQQDVADIQAALTFLQRKVRLFQNSGVVSDSVEGFTGSSSSPVKCIWSAATANTYISGVLVSDKFSSVSSAKEACLEIPSCTGITSTSDNKWQLRSGTTSASSSGEVSYTITNAADCSGNRVQSTTSNTGKTKATKEDLVDLQTRIHAAILTLSASSTTDATVVARIKSLQAMYEIVGGMVNKLDDGTWKASDVTVYKEDIVDILPNLADPGKKVIDIFSQSSGKKLSPVQAGIAKLVGEENADMVFKDLVDKGMFKMSMDIGYNISDSLTSRKKSLVYSSDVDLLGDKDGANKSKDWHKKESNEDAAMSTDSPFDSSMLGMDDRAPKKQNVPSGLDWKKRTEDICTQVQKRGLDPLDFGCIRPGSTMSPAYSWRGHAKMVCGRLNATMDPDLPRVSGCPPSNWKGWSLSY